ncbi:LuxR C-terminal-related transcriptional regulator [Arthrobacter sp. RAF14]|uniref:helix-turn-helix transcriptional regulator n=1 Tax=Arthrobacter sp. RAF14 TaxID=3233051 RepID=UPI003F90D6CA
MNHANDDLRRLIVEGSTTPPQFDAAFVHRTGLIDQVRSGDSRVVTVSAPAGYGKTSLLAEWCQSEDRAVGWLSFREEDNDPAALLRLLAHACMGFAPGAAVFDGQVPTVDGAVLGRAAPALALALSRAERSFVLFLDDVHLLSAVDCLDVLDVVLAGVPRGSQIVLAARHGAARFARTGLAAGAARISADDLRIDLTGAATIAEEVGVAVQPAALRDWVDRCDGWAAGIHMCALLAKDGSSASVSDHELFADYLYQECLKDLTEDTRQFLVRSSVLKWHIPDLCDAVLDRTDSARVLRSLETRQLFVTAERTGRAYRLHPLFQEFLHHELLREASGSVPALHLRAAQWFQEVGRLPEAIEHAIAAENFDLAMALVTAAALEAYEAGHDVALSRWLRQIGDRPLLSNASALVIIAWFAVLAGTDDDADKWSTLLRQVPDGVGADGMNFTSAKSMIEAIMMKGGLKRALVQAEYAAQTEPLGSPWRDPALQIFGSTLLHSGLEDQARPVLQEARFTADARRNPATIVICETEFALLAIENNEWARARKHVDEALEIIREHGIDGYVMCAYARAAAACVRLQAGDRKAGEQLLAAAMADRLRCGRAVPLLAIPSRLLLARGHLQVGDHEAAALLLGEAESMLPPEGGRAALDERVEAVRRAVRGASDRAGKASPMVSLTAAEQRVLPYLQTHLTRAEIALRLFVSPNTVGTQISAIFRKFGVTNRADAVQKAFALGLLGVVVESPTSG